ncbi:Rz1-like lysis system protein LysC [Desulfovibrio sp. An276]|uniref:Rz1-like lysis system protein LysC n=1 Tax=Desulfovibrio sp. An276 TaxID=1965618 RepID=UPI00406C3276
MSASGCGHTPPPPQLIPVLPPADLMQPTSAPQWTPRTNKELLRWAIETDRALMQCNADKAAMQTYAESVQAEAEE